MIKLFINNIPVQVPTNSSILEACEKLGIILPRFCYHENLNVSGNCRMCLIEIENLPKPVAACAYPAINNLRVFTNTPLVKKARENVLEFLLINHPLDCPICDQGGECDLQEQTLLFGSNKSRFFFKKRAVEDINCSPLIKLIMTRCIHCTRCVRFFQEICNHEKLGTLGRGTHTEISLYTANNLNTEFSGNVIDLCPVGALTSKTYAFSSRPWEINSSETIDLNDSIGTNIKVNLKGNDIIRILPLKTEENNQWITDKTRFFFDGLKLNTLAKNYQIYKNNTYPLKWNRVLNIFSQIFFQIQKKNTLSNLIVVGSTVSLESLELLKRISYFFNIQIINENLFQTSTNNVYNYQTNLTINNIQNQDLILFFGINPRIESALYNLQVKQCFNKKNNLIVANIGLNDNFLYNTIQLGNSYKTFINILEGKHTFCKKIAKATNPAIIFGSNLQKSANFNKLTSLLPTLTKNLENTNLIYGTLNSEANETGINTIFSNTKIDFSKIKTIFFFEPNNIETLFKKLPKINQAYVHTTLKPQINSNKIKLITPNLNFLEQSEHFLNYANELKQTAQIIKKNTSSRSISILCKAFLMLVNINAKNFNKQQYLTNNNTLFLTKLAKNQTLYKMVSNKITKSIIKGKYSNHYQTNLVSKNSLILAKSTLNVRKNYTNF